MKHWRGPDDRRSYHHGNLKEALIEAARGFIAQRGLLGFTLVEAAKLVGVTPAALYRHFRGREALVAEVAFRGFTQLSERLARSLAGSGTPIERFTRMGEAYLDFAEKEPGYYAAMFAPAPVDGGGPEGGPPLPTTRPGSAFDLLVKALEATFPDGFGTVDRKFVALEVLALAHGLAMLEMSSQLPRGPGLPGKHEVLRAGVLALVYGASARR